MRSGFLNACPPSEVSVSSSSAAQDKGIRNKRKFRTDNIQQPSVTVLQSLDGGLEDGDGECSNSWTLSPSCSLNSGDVHSCIADRSSCFNIGSYSVSHAQATYPYDDNIPYPATHCAKALGFCNGCCKEDTEYIDLQEPDWDNKSESQLEEILVNILDVLYKDAVGKIVSLGFSEKDALDAVLKNGRWNGKDALTSVVESSLAWLRSGEARQGALDFTNLKDMERHVLAEMICLLRKVRPFLSKGDAMWCLLVCDMNLLLACAMEDDTMSPPAKDAPSPSQTALSLKLKTTCSSSIQNIPSNAVPLPQQAPRISQAVTQASNSQDCKQPLGGLGNHSRDIRSAFSTPSFSSSLDGKFAVANRQTNSAKNSVKSLSTSKNGQHPPIVPRSNGNLVQEPQVQTATTPSSPKVLPTKVQVSQQQTTRLGLHTCKCAS
eukprot:c24816_g2_i2 orf=2-1300(-)